MPGEFAAAADRESIDAKIIDLAIDPSLVYRCLMRERDDRDNWLVRPDKFELGQMVMTPGARDSVPPSEMMRALRRHAAGDWGLVHVSDKRCNDRALIDGDRLFSAYETVSGTRFYIITEADRSVTTVLLPEEY